MLKIDWRTKSLRFWLTFGLLLAVLPLGLSSVLTYFLLHRGVIDSFADVASRHRYQLAPTSQLRTLVMEANEPIDDFVDDGDPTASGLYRALRERIEAGFAAVHLQLSAEPEARTLVERAREDWTAADRLALEVLSLRRAPGDPRGDALMRHFQGLVDATVDKLGALGRDLEQDLARDHDIALRFYERSEWITGAAAVLSLLALIGAVVTIGRIVSASVDRLVTGAERFASGDRAHRIDVQVPPELHSVAEEFNRMIVRIHESEAALADLGRRDGLTKLLNRRAFDDALANMVERMRLLGEAGALLAIDIDHFKRVNDTYGHGVGDDVLRAVARAIGSDVRLSDRVFRVGGEEFAVLLSGTDAVSAPVIAERLRQIVADERITVPGGVLSPTISVGVATTAGGGDGTTLVTTADAALYRAKQQGRNAVVVSG